MNGFFHLSGTCWPVLPHQSCSTPSLWYGEKGSATRQVFGGFLLPFFLNTPWKINMWAFPKTGVPQNGWFIMENPIRVDDLGVPLFLETPMLNLKVTELKRNISQPSIFGFNMLIFQDVTSECPIFYQGDVGFVKGQVGFTRCQRRTRG